MTGAPDRSMGLLDMIPLGLIWWVWEQKPEWKQKPDVSGSHDPNAPKEAGKARNQYFIEKWKKEDQELHKKKVAAPKKKAAATKKKAAPKKKTPVREAARARKKSSAPKKWDPSKIKCYRCSKQIGARAPHCVHCGAPKKKVAAPKKKAAATKKKAAPKKKTPVREAARARKKSSALITVCEDCGGKISKRLDSCPHCGWSTKPTISCPDCGASFAASLPACPECGGPRA